MWPCRGHDSGSNPGPGANKGVERTETKFNSLNTYFDRENSMVSRVDMDKWRFIDYERRLKREAEILKRSSISEINKKLINRYRNHRLAKGGEHCKSP